MKILINISTNPITNVKLSIRTEPGNWLPVRAIRSGMMIISPAYPAIGRGSMASRAGGPRSRGGVGGGAPSHLANGGRPFGRPKADIKRPKAARRPKADIKGGSGGAKPPQAGLGSSF